MGKKIRKEKIVYASTNSPIVEGLQPSDIGIKLRAKAIETRGIMETIMLWERPDGFYETVYGARAQSLIRIISEAEQKVNDINHIIKWKEDYRKKHASDDEPIHSF